jgi:hypothetical protein
MKRPTDVSEKLMSLISRTYDMAAAANDTTMVDTLTFWGSRMIGSNRALTDGDRLIPLLRSCAEEHVEFGRDVLTSLLKGCSGVEDLVVRYTVVCPFCDETWKVPSDCIFARGHCWECGNACDEWSTHRVD